MSVPDYQLGETLDFKFTSRAFATGMPTTLAGTPAVEIYEDNSTTQITAAETLTADFDGVTGLNNLRVVATTANGFESGKSYQAVLSAGTVDGVSVVGEVVAQFSIERDPSVGIFTTQLAESYAADGVAPTPAQALFLIQQMLTEKSVAETTVTVKKLDGAVTAFTLTLDEGANPSSITRTG